MRKEPRLHGNANKVAVIFLLLFAIFFIGGAWFLTEQGPGSAGRSSRKSGKASPDLPMKVSALVSSAPRIEEWKLSEGLILEASQVADLRSIVVKVEEVQMESASERCLNTQLTLAISKARILVSSHRTQAETAGIAKVLTMPVNIQVAQTLTAFRP